MNTQNNKRWFTDRNNEDYLKLLYEKLDFDYLVNTAIPVIGNDGRYNKIIRIDFCGIAGSTFLLEKNSEWGKKVRKRFLELFSKLDVLKEQKIALKTRFAFMYLYSDFSYAQIEAEKTDYRATIKNNHINNEDAALFSLTDKDFFASQIFNNQRKALKQIQGIYNAYYRSPNMENMPNILNIRFSCLPLNICQLVINHHIFIDPYAYAKQDEDSELAYETPVVHVERSKQLETFEILEDHFRYIWNHPTTMFYEDCTDAEFDDELGAKLDKLNEIRVPNNVTFNIKINRLKTKLNISEEKLKRWQFKIEGMFKNMTRIIQETPQAETIFIGFSFINGEIIAKEINKFLDIDFGTSLKVNIVDIAKGNDTLFTALTQQMQEATIAMIFLTKDIKDNSNGENLYYSRPNIYFELGYLYSHLSKYGPALKRIITFAEDDKLVPSDFKDAYCFKMTKNVYLDYVEILNRILDINRTLTLKTAEEAVLKMLERLQEAYNNKIIDDNSFSQKSFNDYKSYVKGKLMSTINNRFNKKK
jgi:predicted nucleotide-binding protein